MGRKPGTGCAGKGKQADGFDLRMWSPLVHAPGPSAGVLGLALRMVLYPPAKDFGFFQSLGHPRSVLGMEMSLIRHVLVAGT